MFDMSNHRIATIPEKKKKRRTGTRVDRGVQKLDPPCTVGGYANWDSHSEKLYGEASKY